VVYGLVEVGAKQPWAENISLWRMVHRDKPKQLYRQSIRFVMTIQPNLPLPPILGRKIFNLKTRARFPVALPNLTLGILPNKQRMKTRSRMEAVVAAYLVVCYG